jgi:putative ABC transport system permease protein
LSLAAVVGYGGFAHSFYASVGEWMDRAFNPDFFLSASANLVSRAITFPGDIGPLIQQVAGVADVQLVRNARVTFRNVPVMVIAVEADKVGKTVRHIVVAGSSEEMNRLTSEGRGIIVSDSFAQIHDIGMGELVEIPSPSGLLKLPIVGIVRDFSDMMGTIFIDRSVYTTWWKDDTANVARVYVTNGEDVAAVRQRVLDAIAGRQRLLVLTNREVKDWVMRLINQWFALTYNQIGVAILVAVLGIVNTLTVSITDRRRELGVMQAVGGLRNQIRRTVWLEALTIGAIGLILGIAFGAVNLYYTLGMVKRDLGGVDLDYIFPLPFVLAMAPAILAAAFVAALGPAESAVRGSLVEALEYE